MADVVNDWNRLEKQIRLVESNDSSCLVLKCRFEAPSNSVAVPLWDGFCKALMVNTRLHSLDLSRNPTFGDKGAQSLAAALPFNTSLTRLNLRACHIGRQGAAALAESLRENRSLVDLDLSDNAEMGPEAASILEAVKDHKSLMILKLCACDLRPNEETLNALRRLVKYNPVLRTLDIHHNYFPHEALRKFFIAIRESSVTKMTELDLDSMGVGIVAMKELIETLNVKTQLSSLSLRKNAIGGAPIASLLRGIRTNGSLTQLNLARSRLKDVDLKAMGDFLRDPHACLKELDISDNGLSKHAMEIIVENWGGNKSLTSLSLGRNNFSSSDLSHFISYVSASNSWRVEFPAPGGVSSTISSLDFSELKAFGPTQAKELAALIRTDSTPFDRIILHGTSIDSASGRVFLEACKKSSTLSFLDLRKTTLANEEMYDFALHYSTSPTLSRVLMDYTDPKKLLYCKILARLNLSEVPQPILKATHLAKLNLKSNRLTSLPPDIANLTDLVSLSLQNNLLETLPSELGFVTSLKKLKLDGNPLRTPPVELRQSAAGKAGKILGYLRDLHHGLEYVYRVKLMFVGQENVGKTTLLSLLKKKYKSKTYKSSKSFSRQGSAASMMRTKSGRLEQFLSTDGIDINEIQMEVPMPKLHAPQPPTFASRSRSLVGNSTPGSRSSSITLSSSSKGGGVHHHHHHHHHPAASSHSNLHIAPTTALNATAGASCPSGSSSQLEKRTITLSTWDFGGQDIYYSTHQFFLSDHSIFLILWDMRYEEEKSKVGFWLQSIQARTNNALAIIVGTHADDPSCGGGIATKKIEQVKYKYRKIKMVKGCIGLSCLNGDLTELIATLTSVIQEMPIMGNAVPSSYMALSHFIRQYREATDAEREAMLRFSEGQSSPLSSSSSIQPLLTSATQSMLLQSQGSSSSLSSVGSGVVPPINPPPVSPMASRSFGPRRASSANTLFVGSLGSSTGSSSSTTTGGGQSSPTPSPRSLEPISIPYKSWSDFSKLAKLCHIDDGEDLKRCAETLHLMGDIVYFDDPKLGLSDLVILDSQFLTHVMATIITTKQNYVKNGVINYNDLRHIWKLPLFPTEIHPYLLAILEKFEIVFTANEQLTKRLVEYFDISPAIKSPAYPMSGLGVIPSLLPEAVPVLDLLWTKFDEKILQYDRQYVFDLVPAGLFSRLIVRCLHTATEVLHCWRYGTVFLCADSMCLVELNNRKSSISVTMRGGKNPAEQLRNIMEVIEALILRDNWWRTSVTRQISCLSCLQHLTNNHHHSSTTPRSDGNETAEDKTGSSDSIRTSQSNKNFNVTDYIPDAPKRSRSNSSSADPSASSRKGSSHGFRYGESTSRPERKGSSKSAKASSTRSEGSPSTTKRPTVTVLSSPPTSPRGIVVGSPAGSSPPVTRVFDVVAIPQFDSIQGKRPPSLGQLKYARDATALTPTSSSSTIPSNLSTSSFNRDGSNGSVGATSSVGSPATSSENLVGGSAANMEVEPCYIPLEDCERAAAEGNAFVTCEQGHMIRLDRLAPDVALADFEGIRIPFNDISLEYPSFARGSFGELFKGTWKGQEVAVKQLVCDPLEAQRIYHEFRREVWIMSSLNHPNLVNLKGFCLEPSPSMVMEYIAGGNLYSFLHANDSDTAGPSPLDAALILKIALDVANGINFLHSATPPYIHRDLKSPNILLTNTDPTADVVAKVADFGLTNRMVIPLRKEGRSQRAVVNPTWQAPEIMREEEFSEKSDTYAYGIILWELYTRRHPFGDIKSNFLHDVEDAVVRDKRRPPIPDSCPREFAKLMQECWAEEPNNRPDFKRIIDDLHFMIEKMGFSNLIQGSRTKPLKPRTHKPSRKQSSEKVPPSASGHHHHHHHHKERRAAKSSVGASNSLGPTPSSKAQTSMLETSSSITEAEGSKLLSSDVYGESENLQPPTAASVKKMKRRSAPIQRPRSSERRSPTRMGTLESMDSSGSIDSTIELRRASFSSSRSNDSSTVAFENPIHSDYLGSLVGQTSYSMMSRTSGSLSGGATRSSNSSGNTTTTTITSSVTSSEAPSSSKSTSGHAESVDDSNPHFSILPMRSDPSSLVPSSLPTIPEKESINPRTSSSMLSTLSQEEEEDSDLDFMDSNMRDNQGGHSSSSDDSGVSRPDSSSSSDMEGEEPSPRHGGRPSVSQQPSSLLQQDDGPFDNPVFAGGANASSNLAGRFTKQLRVVPPTRITTLFPVGTSQIWGTGRDGSVHIWNAKNGELLSAHEKAHDGCIKAAVPVLDTVWMSCPKQQAIGVWHVRRADMGSRVEKRSGTLQVGQWSVSSQKVSHWKMRFVVINFKDGSLKVFPMPKEPTSSKNAGSFSEFSTPTTAPMKEISLINTPTNPVTFGLAIEHSPSTFKVCCQSITLYFELEEEHDMLEWLECIASIATGDRLICLTTLSNEWTKNITVMHVPSVKGELLITGSSDSDMSVVSWNVHTKSVVCSVKLSAHFDRDTPMPEGKDAKITSIVTSTKHRYTLAAVGSIVFVLNNKTLDVVQTLRKTPSPIVSMAIARPKEIWTTCKDGSIHVWNAQSLTYVASFPSPSASRIYCIVPVSSTRVWTAGKDGIIRIWNSADRTLEMTLPAHHRGSVQTLILWHHSMWSCGPDKTICIWT